MVTEFEVSKIKEILKYLQIEDSEFSNKINSTFIFTLLYHFSNKKFGKIV